MLCPDRSDDKYQCSKRGELCSHYHSEEERNDAFRIMKVINKELLDNKTMELYLDDIKEEEKSNKIINS